jgi:lantibiotic modifying enzyme
MCQPISRRQLLGMGLGAAASVVALPKILSAFPPSNNSHAPLTDLEVALRAAKWIRRSRIETKSGVTWPADPRNPTSVQYNLYNGMPGVILFHVELFDATGDRAWLDEAKAGANELIAQLPALQQANAAGLYEGLAGAAFVLEETHRASGEGKYRDAAKSAIAMIHSLAKKTATGASWTGGSATHDIISGSAGIGLALLWADQQWGDADSRTLALAVGRDLLDAGIPEKGGTKWNVAPSVTNLYPNFSHGTAGVGFFLARLYRLTQDRGMYAAALSAARYLDAVANHDDGGLKVFHHEPGGEGLYYLSWCHGPAGSARLFNELAMISPRGKWHEVVEQCATATIASGVPEKQSSGYWNNISQCCGNAGVGEFFITLSRLDDKGDKPAYRDMVKRVAANTLSRATEDGDGLKWIQAENRVSPEAVVAQTGFMQGAAGVGTFYLHADGLAKGRKPLVEWPDAFSTERCLTTRVKATRDMSDLTGKGFGPCDPTSPH